MILLIIIAIWIISGVFAYGIILAYFQNKYSIFAEEMYWGDVFLAILFGFGGLLGLVIGLVLSGWGRYGLMFRRNNKI